ncbi:MAG: hypothetical protein K0U52_08285 [Gammaproteobacteria bacterium]|nr:hypothetical protein [Gammaproteobacteria bacterium]
MSQDQQPLTAGGFGNMTLLGVTEEDNGYQRVHGDKLTGQNGNGDSKMLYWARRWLGQDVVFVIQRLMNRNVLAYQSTNDPGCPVKATWIMIPEGTVFEDNDSASDDSVGEDDLLPLPDGVTTEALTRMESSMAYGIQSMGRNVFSIIALGGEPIRIQDDEAQIQWQNNWSTLTEIIVHTEDRFMGLWPRVRQLDICCDGDAGEFVLHFEQ